MSTEKSQIVTEIIDRLKIAYGLRTDAALADYLDVKPNTISMWKKRGFLDYDLIFTKCDDISPGWIMTGEGAVSLTDEKRFQRVTADKASEAPAAQPYGEYVYIPQVSGEISAGGGLLADNTIEMRIAFRRDWIERKGDHSKMSITRVKGDSMEPTLMSGDIVLIDHSRNYVDPHGGIYAIAFENEIMVKRVQVLFPANQLRVISDNPKYQPADVDPSTVNINGKVIWFGRELER